MRWLSVLGLAFVGCGFDSSGVSGSASDSVGTSGDATSEPQTSGEPPTTTSASTSASTTTDSTTASTTATTDDPTLTTSMSSTTDDETSDSASESESASETSGGTTDPTQGTTGDDDATTSTANPEVCDGFDNDGDGGVDEGSADNPSCDGCTFFLGVTGEYWFSICGDGRTYASARDRCMGFEGDLAKIEQLEDQLALLAAVGEDHWVGIDDLQVEGTWLFVDGTVSISDGMVNGFDGWGAGQPSGGLVENCAELDPGQAGWADSPCEQQQPYICRHPL